MSSANRALLKQLGFTQAGNSLTYNKSVHLLSTHEGVLPPPVETVNRWSVAEKKYVDVDCPQIVKYYNSSMGGVDILDMLVESKFVPRGFISEYSSIFLTLLSRTHGCCIDDKLLK